MLDRSPANRSLLPSLSPIPCEGPTGELVDPGPSNDTNKNGCAMRTSGSLGGVAGSQLSSLGPFGDPLRGGGYKSSSTEHGCGVVVQPFHIPNMSAMDPFRAMEQEVLDTISHLRLRPGEYVRWEESSLLIRIPPASISSLDPVPPPPPEPKPVAEPQPTPSPPPQKGGKASPISKASPPAPPPDSTTISATSGPAALDSKFAPPTELPPLLTLERCMSKKSADTYIAQVIDSRIRHYSSLLTNQSLTTANDRKQSRAKSVTSMDPSGGGLAQMSPQDELIAEKISSLKTYRDEICATISASLDHVQVMRDRAVSEGDEGRGHFCFEDTNSLSSSTVQPTSRLTHGICLAARELALAVDVWARDVRKDEQLRQGEGGMRAGWDLVRSVPDDDMTRMLLRYGRLSSTRHIFGVVVLGTHTAADIALLSLRHFLQSTDSSIAAFMSAAAKAPMGVGWQKHPVHGAVTAVIVAIGFEELLFLKTRSFLPAMELGRCFRTKQIPQLDAERYDLRFLPESLGIKVVYPLSHPIRCSNKEDAVLLLTVPPGLILSCVEEKPSGIRNQDHVTNVTECSSSRFAFVDRDGRYLRITLRCPIKKTALAIVARSPSSAQYTHCATVLVVNDDTDQLHQSSPSSVGGNFSSNVERSEFPSATDYFQQVGGMLVAPRMDLLGAEEPVDFEIRCSSGVQSCSITGAHGTHPLTRLDGSSPPSSLASSPQFGRSANVSPGAGPGLLAKLEKSSTVSSRSSTAVSVFAGRVARPREGSLTLWIDGFAALQWTVTPPRVVLTSATST